MQKKTKMKRMAPTRNWLVKDDKPSIREKCENVSLPLTDSDWEKVSKMVSYVDYSYEGEYDKYKITPGVAIASNQIGWQKKVIYLHFDDEFGNEKLWLLANPEIISISDKITYLDGGEGCLSVPKNHSGIVPRYDSLTVKAYDLFNDKEIIIKESGFSAIVLQHELDHLNGMLYYDHINMFDKNFVSKDWKKI